MRDKGSIKSINKSIELVKIAQSLVETNFTDEH